MGRTADKEIPDGGEVAVKPKAVRVACPADYPAVMRYLARCTPGDGRRDGDSLAPEPTAPRTPTTVA